MRKELSKAFKSYNRRARLWKATRYAGMSGSLTLLAMMFVLVGIGKYALHLGQVSTVVSVEEPALQFPVGVDTLNERIMENANVEGFWEQHLASVGPTKDRGGWFEAIMSKLALFDWYQNMASASSRILVIRSNERKEQVADNFKKILGWNDAERARFLEIMAEYEPEIKEGNFYPGTYAVIKGAKPEEVAPIINERFREQVLDRYGPQIEAYVPLEQAIIVASLLEREAYDFTDMRHISGVIWNRLFIDMKLQLDATLQYARGSQPHEPWWPKPVPADKYIDSPYNTYQNVGLPPTAIANPSAEAILAALNPTATDCMFYFHDAYSNFHCTTNYEDHVKLLKQFYGRGR